MPNSTALAQLQRLSRPFVILLSIALGLAVFIQIAYVAVLLCFHAHGDWRAAVSFSTSGTNLAFFSGQDSSTDVALGSLAMGQRAALALLTAISGACGALVLFHLRQLFALYAQGVVFAPDNIRHIKQFGIWLVAAAIAVNLGGRLFLAVTGQHAHGTANAVMALVYGGMTWVIARVMELAREADEERKEFI